ncbi:MAG: Flp pilus assembly protein CpaB [Magnetospirillum sp.]|nr:MAG: Flp pilus assembly protein CpaB [Magnetospirillum sp.]
MRPIAIVLVVAALAAGLTGILAKAWLDRQVAVAPTAETLAVSEVLVTAREVMAGSVISSDDLRYESWPNSVVTPRLVIRRPGEDPRAQLIGQVTRRTLTEGEPFTAAATFRQDSAGILAGILAPGMRAISIAITDPSAVSGFVTPGDRVDIVLATDMQRAVESADRQNSVGGPILRYAAETILSDVRVLAIDQKITRGRDGAAIQGKTATVEVTAKQGEILTTAGMIGTLQLVLRGLPDGGAAAPPPEEGGQPGYTADTETSKALQALVEGRAKPVKTLSGGGGASVKINRAGTITSEGFAR